MSILQVKNIRFVLFVARSLSRTSVATYIVFLSGSPIAVQSLCKEKAPVYLAWIVVAEQV